MDTDADAIYPEDSIVGVLSDSHGRSDITRRAVQLLISRGASVLIHLGDFEGVEVIDALGDCVGNVPTHVVFGNVDFAVDVLAARAALHGLKVNHPAGRILFGDKDLVFTHGHFFRVEREAIACGANWFCHGHSHEVRDEQVGETHIVNPGALFRASRYNVALIEPAGNRVQHLDVPRE